MEEKKNREGNGGKHFEIENIFWEEKEKEVIIWRRKINGDANQPTDQGTGQIKCNLPFEGWKIESRYLQMLSDNTPATAL